MSKGSKRQIEPVKDNMDKYLTYRSHATVYKIALEKKFYFEAITIAYAMLEDRLFSFYYHIGAISRRYCKVSGIDTPHVEEVINAILKDCVGKEKYKRNTSEKAGERFIRLDQIGNKIQVLRALLICAKEEKQLFPDDPYYQSLMEILSKGDVKEMLRTVDKILKWNEYRNEVVHALFVKSMESLLDKLPEMAEIGIKYAQAIDNLSNRAKTEGIRKQLGL